MSDSSEDEDLSRFRDAVDNSFIKLINDSRGKISTENKEKPPSERYLEVASHYNDVKVSDELQKRIGAKVSAIIAKNIEFIDVPSNTSKKLKIKGGVKLFKDSEAFVSCDDVNNDVNTQIHNQNCKKIKNSKKRRHIDTDIDELSETEKINSSVVSGDYVLSKKEVKLWKSRRKEKILPYKAVAAKHSDKQIVAVEQ